MIEIVLPPLATLLLSNVEWILWNIPAGIVIIGVFAENLDSPTPRLTLFQSRKQD